MKRTNRRKRSLSCGGETQLSAWKNWWETPHSKMLCIMYWKECTMMGMGSWGCTMRCGQATGGGTCRWVLKWIHFWGWQTEVKKRNFHQVFFFFFFWVNFIVGQGYALRSTLHAILRFSSGPSYPSSTPTHPLQGHTVRHTPPLCGVKVGRRIHAIFGTPPPKTLNIVWFSYECAFWVFLQQCPVTRVPQWRGRSLTGMRAVVRKHSS